MQEVEENARKRIGQVPMWIFTTSIFHINGAIDRGETASIDEIRNRIQDETVLDWLATSLIGELAHEDLVEHRVVLSDLFASLVETDNRRKFEVENNGLCLLIAYFVEALQQWGEARRVRT
jgi:hypothetical protein